MQRRYPLRLFQLVLGSFVSSIGIVMMLQANIGLEPWSVFQQGLEKATGISFGMASVVVGLAAIAIAVVLGESFGVGTIGNIILCGVLIDAVSATGLIPQMTSLAGGVPMLLGGMELLVLGTWLYMASALGSGPRDALTVALVRHTGRSVGLCRTTMEVLVTATGWLLGGQVGVGTVLAAALLGSMMGLTFRLLRFRPAELHQETVAETARALFGRA